MSKSEKPKIAVLASGEGTNFEAIVEAVSRGELNCQVAGVLCNRPGAQVLERAARLKVPAALVSLKEFPSAVEWNLAIRGQLLQWGADWVVLAGYTGLIGASVLQAFSSRIVNSHPSLLPKFGGKGMYGRKVHSAVIAAGETETGITVHLVNERFDEGPILAQKKVPVRADDTVESLAERLQAEERKFYPQVLQDMLTGRLKR